MKTIRNLIKGTVDLVKAGVLHLQQAMPLVAVALALLMMGSSAHAQTTSSSYVSQFQTAANQIIADLTAVIPIALTVFAIGFGIVIVKKIFKTVAK